MPQRQYGLDDSGDTGAGLQVTDVRFHRADEAWLPGGPASPEHGGHRGGLDRVTGAGTRAMRLHVVDRRRLHAGHAVGAAQQVDLRLPAGGHDAVGVAVLVDRAAADHREHLVSVTLGVGEPFQDDHCGALPAAVAVRCGVEGLAAAVRRDRACRVEDHGQAGTGHDVHAADQRDRSLTEGQRLTGEVDGDQRRRAGRVHGEAGTAQIESVGDAVGDGTHGGPDAGPCLDAGQVLEQAATVVVRADADEHPGVATGKARRRDTRVLERLPGDLQQDALLRVHQLGFARHDSEKFGVESLDVVEEATEARGLTQRRGVLLAGFGVGRPPLWRDLGDRILAPCEQPPEFLGCVRAAREAATHANDRNGFCHVSHRIVSFEHGR